jgi:hypothetical protein
MEQDRLYMLACVEAVEAKINAIAGEVVLPGITNLDGVRQATFGFDGEFGKKRMRWLAIRDLERLRAPPDAAADESNFIACPIITDGRRLNSLKMLLHGVEHFLNPAGNKRQLLEIIRAIFPGYSQSASPNRNRNYNPNPP